MTFAATAEVVRYLGAVPVLVDCSPETGNLDLADAERKLADLRAGRLSPRLPRDARVVGMIPVHVGGLMLDMDVVSSWAKARGLWVVEDAAHAFPAAYRKSARSRWRRCGQKTAAVSCFSFYANKTITTGEGGMAVTDDRTLADRMRLMSLHGLSHDAWDRYKGGRSWDYRIMAPGFKYNLTDVAAAIGVHQLARAEEMRRARERVAHRYLERLGGIEELELPPEPPDRIHAWHLFPIRLRLDRLGIDRNRFLDELKKAGVGVLRPLAPAPSPSLLHGDLRLEEGRLPGRDRTLAQTRQPPDIPGDAGRRDRKSHARRRRSLPAARTPARREHETLGPQKVIEP